MNNITTTNTSMHNVAMMEYAYKVATIMSKSDIVPAHYRDKLENAFIAVQTALRMHLDPMMVMQNTYIVSGKLGMTSAFAISLANSSGLFVGGIRYRVQKLSEDIEGSVKFYNNGKEDKKKVQFSNVQVTAYTNLKSNGEEISYTIGMKDAIAEGWTTKAGNKYQSLPELMLRYRAATLLIRTHAPEVINGMHMTEELEDVAMTRDVTPKVQTLSSKLDEIILEQAITNDDITVVEEQSTEKPDELCELLCELVITNNISRELVDKWCDKAGVASIDQLNDEQMQKCINYVNNTNTRLAHTNDC